MDTNARVRETKALLSGALLRLLEKKPIAAITISELCSEAQVNRSTFYRYYQTLYDLLLATHEQIIDTFEAQITEGASDRNTLIGVLETMRRQPMLNLALNEVLLHEALAGRLSQHPKDFMRRIFLDRMPKKTALYFGAASTAILQRWLTDGCEPPGEIADLLIGIARSTGNWKTV